MVHLYRPRPKTLAIPAVRAVVTVGLARSACTGRVAGGGYEGYRGAAGGNDKNGPRRDKVRFLAVAETTRGARLSGKQKLFCAPTQLKECKEVIIFCTSILCPEVVQGMTTAPLLFWRPRNIQKLPNQRFPQKHVS